MQHLRSGLSFYYRPYSEENQVVILYLGLSFYVMGLEGEMLLRRGSSSVRRERGVAVIHPPS